MTNKNEMPVVGKRYRHKINGVIYKAFKHPTKQNRYFMESQSPEALDLIAYEDDFWSEYEELPDQPQANKEVKVNSIEEEKVKWRKILEERFGGWVNPSNNKIILKIIGKNGSGEQEFYKIEDLINPKYSTFELIKKILKNYDDYCGGAEIATQNSNNYNNLLFCLAAVYDCADDHDLMIWQQRFNSKFNL